MELLDFILKYGAEVALIAFASIFLVGVIKLVFKKPLEKIEKANRKPIYEALSIVFAYALTTAWLAVRVAWFHMPVDPFSWALVAEKGSIVYIAVKVMYPLYENFKLRDFFQLIGRWVLTWFKKKDKKAVADNKDNNTSGPTIL